MIIVKGKLESLKKSSFYDEKCWDYPKEEKSMLEGGEEYSETIYVQVEDERIYETYCTTEQISQLIKELEKTTLKGVDKK